MIGLLIMFFVTRHVARVAGSRGHSEGRARAVAVVLFLAAECAGIAVGYRMTHNFGWAEFGGLVGTAVVGSFLALLYAHRLPVLWAAEHADPKAAQVVGSACGGCGKRIAVLLGVSRCRSCQAPCHDPCLEEHEGTHTRTGGPLSVDSAHGASS